MELDINKLEHIVPPARESMAAWVLRIHRRHCIHQGVAMRPNAPRLIAFLGLCVLGAMPSAMAQTVPVATITVDASGLEKDKYAFGLRVNGGKQGWIKERTNGASQSSTNEQTFIPIWGGRIYKVDVVPGSDNTFDRQLAFCTQNGTPFPVVCTYRLDDKKKYQVVKMFQDSIYQSQFPTEEGTTTIVLKKMKK
jgi:hypothetical protein